MTEDGSNSRDKSRAKLHDELARWIEERRERGAIPRADDGWPDVEAWRDAARSEGYECTSDDVRQAIRIALLFRRIANKANPPTEST
jgi:hypothetical protein